MLLANDTDPDGPALDITAVSNANGLGNLSLATNPGSVTFTDTGTAGGSFTYTVSDGRHSRTAPTRPMSRSPATRRPIEGDDREQHPDR